MKTVEDLSSTLADGESRSCISFFTVLYHVCY